jgi:hypothetical protein
MDVIDKIWVEKWLKVSKNSSYGSFSNSFTITLGVKINELRKKKIEGIWKNKLKD